MAKKKKEEKERKSGTKIKYDALFSDLDYKIYLKPYTTFRKEYLKQLEKVQERNQKKKKCYIVTFKNMEDILYVAFAHTYNESCKIATDYFTEMEHPNFTKNMLFEARSRRREEWDRFAKSGKIPINLLLNIGCKFSCCYCGRFAFTYKDVMEGNCFIVYNSDVTLNPFTRGGLVCKECQEKLESLNGKE